MKLTFILLALVTVSALSANGKAETYRTVTTTGGNRIDFVAPIQGRVTVTNKETGEKEVRTFDRVSEKPYMLDGKEILQDHKTYPQIERASIKLQELINAGMKEAEGKLSEGSYQYLIANVVINEKGRVAYYTTDGIKDGGVREPNSTKPVFHDISDKERTMILDAITNTLSKLKTDPLIVDGKAVPFTLDVRNQFSR